METKSIEGSKQSVIFESSNYFIFAMTHIVNGKDAEWNSTAGQVVEEKKGFFASIVAFFLSIFSLISDLYAVFHLFDM